MKTKLTLAASLVLFTLVGVPATARATEANPPLGIWQGAFADGSTLTLMLNGNGNAFYGGVGWGQTGTWSWNATSVGGIVTLHYMNAGFHSKAYYSVTYLDASTIVLSDPYFRLVMRRK